MKTVIVFEDSSRVSFGGGQKMTLMVCDILKAKFNLRLVDFSNSTRYAQIVKEKYGADNFVNIGHVDIRGQRGLVVWLKILLSYLLCCFGDVKKIIYGLDIKECISYSTSKRGLLMAALLKWIYGIPYMHHAHLVENPNGMYYLIAKRLFQGSESILCVSKTVRTSINTPNCQLVYNPSLNERGYKGEKSDNQFVVAFVGSLITIKGIENFVDAAKLCPEKIEFRIYGEGPLCHVLEERANGFVRFMGFEKNIIDRYYEDVDIIVIPTIIQEALSLVAVDAKSVGLPLIVTTPGGQAEIVNDGVDGYHVPIHDSKAIAEAVMRLSSDFSLYNKMSRASYDSFGHFAYNIFKKKVLQAFDKI